MTTLRVPIGSGGAGLTPADGPSYSPHRPRRATLPMPHTRPDTAYRRPVPPYPIETHELPLSSLPSALNGFRVLHISDLHVRRLCLRSGLLGRTLAALPRTPLELVLLTGDYADRPGHEHAALRTLHALASAWRARHGAVAIFGNHDTALMRRLARDVPGLRCIDTGAIDLPDLPLRILAASYPEDLFAAALSRSHDDRFEIALVHDPVAAIAAAELRVPLVLAGHTHGGQVRLSPRGHPPHRRHALLHQPRPRRRHAPHPPQLPPPRTPLCPAPSPRTARPFAARAPKPPPLVAPTATRESDPPPHALRAPTGSGRTPRPAASRPTRAARAGPHPTPTSTRPPARDP
ncbi:MAG: hypothetical protein DYG93_13430 [Leptolyngbya sp. PLA2]|nr:hypothetical protein [Leptolyngbya sp. PL-A2]